MPWGYDDWLTDRPARKRYMRSVALVGLAEQVLRTPAVCNEALACLVDEVTADRKLARAAESTRLVHADVSGAETWARAALDASRAARVAFQSIAVVIPDRPPYDLELTLVGAAVSPDADWAEHIVWRHSDAHPLRALKTQLRALESLSSQERRDGNYILPLAYAAFVMRDVLRRLGSDASPATAAIVSYHGGDSLAVPLTR